MNEELSSRYRIKEITYKDGHKEYVAQEAKRFLFFKWWKPFICNTLDYGYAEVNFICVGETYEECKAQLLSSLKDRKEALDKVTVNTTRVLNL